MARRGELEQRVLEVLWEATGTRSVAEVQESLAEERELAYTTVMTVLDRLAKKGMVRRELVDRAWRYQPADARSTVAARELRDVLGGLPGDVRAAALAEFAASLSDAERALVAGAKENSVQTAL